MKRAWSLQVRVAQNSTCHAKFTLRDWKGRSMLSGFVEFGAIPMLVSLVMERLK